MTRVVAIILHAVPGPGAGALESAFAATRLANAARHARGFEAAGAIARIVETRPGGPPFGVRLRRLAALDAGAGIVVLGSGSVPLATPADRRAFVAAAAAAGSRAPALVNNRYSADIVALPGPMAADLANLPDLAADNGLPRWLEGRGHAVRDLRGRWRLGVDLDSPLDVLLTGDPAGRPAGAGGAGSAGGIGEADLARVRDARARIRGVAADAGAELLVAGRTSAAALTWLEGATACRTRALVEERGFRTAASGQRPTRSTLGLILDRDGPENLGRVVAGLADAAILDSRVLLAHRLGRDEAAWPPAGDRFASDLLLHEGVADPWLRSLTRAAAESPAPILLGGHTLVGPGLRLLIGGRAR